MLNGVFHFSATEKDLYHIGGQLLALSLAHGGQGPHLFSKTLYDVVTLGCEHATPTLNDVHSEQIKAQLNDVC